MANQNGDDDYDVGYGKPPKEHQWEKGESGNPTGKRKREERIEETFARIAEEEILVTQHGSQTTMTQREAVIRAILNKSMKGNVAAFKAITPFLEKTEVQALASSEFTLSSVDLEVLKQHSDWMRVVEAAERELNGTDDAVHAEEGQDDDLSETG